MGAGDDCASLKADVASGQAHVAWTDSGQNRAVWLTALAHSRADAP
ncbi:MAG TPA: hypothetical protein VES01_10335 [Dermatophilaceae bacterium]|nr:hypothetical protein [Dermatophilaceae bacterium]